MTSVFHRRLLKRDCALVSVCLNSTLWPFFQKIQTLIFILHLYFIPRVPSRPCKLLLASFANPLKGLPPRGSAPLSIALPESATQQCVRQSSDKEEPSHDDLQDEEADLQSASSLRFCPESFRSFIDHHEERFKASIMCWRPICLLFVHYVHRS